MKHLEPTQQHQARRTHLTVREHASRSLRRALALAMVDHLKQVAATLRRAPDRSVYMVAAAGVALVLVALSLGARHLGRPLPPEVVDAIPALHRWAVGVKAQARLSDQCSIRSSEPGSYPPNGSEAGKPRGRV
jgi:hypothetical protein